MSHTKWFVRGDLDGFFGLFIDNLLQLMLIAILCPMVCGLPQEMVIGTILPGAAISILVGNLFYAYQAWRLARRTGRDDVTALPYGINTVSLFAYIFLIMAPVYAETHSEVLTWQVGLVACFISGVMELIGAFIGDWLRRHTPRAALLSALSGIAITFISMGFIFQIYASPLITFLPMFIILTGYAARVRWPFQLPSGLFAVLVGTGLAWGLRAAGFDFWHPSTVSYTPGIHLPRAVPQDLWQLLFDPLSWKYLAVIIPMGLFNLIGSLQNLESAAAAGDHYSTRSSLFVNGIGSIVSALLGSAFATTIYIGHPGWKAMGARAGYSALNGIAITLLCLFGGVSLVVQYIPIEATLGILLWIGIIIMAQAFQETPKHHAGAVALGLIPPLASWALLLIESTLRAAGSSLFVAAPKFGTDLYIHGVIALSQGFLLTSMILSATLVFLIERLFHKAAAWMLVGAALSATGFIHAYNLIPTGVQNVIGLRPGGWFFGHSFAAPDFTLAYATVAAVLFGFHLYTRNKKVN
jgi:adenine/guanine/hypoxanthine permease